MFRAWFLSWAKDKLYEEYQSTQRKENSDTPNQPEEHSCPPPRSDVLIVAKSMSELLELQDQMKLSNSIYGKNCQITWGTWRDFSIVLGTLGDSQTDVEKACQSLLHLTSPQWIVSIGFATALIEELEQDVIFLANEIVDESGKRWELDFRFPENSSQKGTSFKIGKLLTVLNLPTKVEEKEKLHQTFEAVVLDQETALIAQQAGEQGIKFLSIRIVADPLTQDVDERVKRIKAQSSKLGKLGAFTGALFQEPQVVKKLWKDQEAKLTSTITLTRFTLGIVAQLDRQNGR
ncbi:Hypothetical protein PBC10988_8360 [Planctomycetales bacterium 10988]|nr:Hypothetical protein PBC10988_8360 [Planctomycetales bacterium 10988]